MACLAVPFIYTSSPKREDFQKKVIEHKICFLISYTNLSETFLILRRIKRDIINVLRSSCKVPVILVRLMKLEFSV